MLLFPLELWDDSSFFDDGKFFDREEGVIVVGAVVVLWADVDGVALFVFGLERLSCGVSLSFLLG